MKVYAKEAQGIQNSIKLMLLHPGVSISNDTQTQKDKHGYRYCTVQSAKHLRSLKTCTCTKQESECSPAHHTHRSVVAVISAL